jgi:hypothetical protein
MAGRNLASHTHKLGPLTALQTGNFRHTSLTPRIIALPCTQVMQDQTSWDGSPYIPLTEVVWLHLDGTRVTEKVIGQGATGIIIEQGQYALKLPHISRYTKINGVPVEEQDGSLTPRDGDYDERPPPIASIEVEKAIYRRLDNDHEGIVRCHNLVSTEVSIQMDRMGKWRSPALSGGKQTGPKDITILVNPNRIYHGIHPPTPRHHRRLFDSTISCSRTTWQSSFVTSENRP